jgi:hypothetical protein
MIMVGSCALTVGLATAAMADLHGNSSRPLDRTKAVAANSKTVTADQVRTKIGKPIGATRVAAKSPTRATAPDEPASAVEPAADTTPAAADDTSAAAATGSKMILLQGPTGADKPDGPSTRPPAMIKNYDHIQTLGDALDGVVLDYSIGWNAMSGSVVDCDQERRSWVEPLMESGVVTKFEHNFLRLQIRRIDVFDDSASKIVEQNWACMGQLAKESETLGLFVDTESYDGPAPVWKNSIYNWFPDSGYTLAEYKTKVRQRFREWTAAYMTEFPEGQIIYSRGSVDGVPAPSEIDLYSSPEEFEATVAAMVGSLEGATRPEQITDGMQLYWLRTEEDYQRACAWTETELPGQSGDIPNDLLDEWQAMPCAPGFYDKEWPQNDPDYAMDPDIFRDQVIAAASEERVNYRWMFLENGDLMDASYAQQHPEWLQAIRQAHQASVR